MVLEPASRNTAPATTIVAIAATGNGADPVLFVLPADHFIADETAFAGVVERGVSFAESGGIVVFGIPPTHPATGYGYIRARAGANGGGVAKVAAFAEKPSLTTAEQFSPKAAGTGTAACSCSARASTSTLVIIELRTSRRFYRNGTDSFDDP